MMTEKLQKVLNEQVTAEMWSANLYLSMSFHLEREGYTGFASWLKKQSQEEMEHAYAIAGYIIKRGRQNRCGTYRMGYTIGSF